MILSLTCINTLWRGCHLAIRPPKEIAELSKNYIASNNIQGNYIVLDRDNTWRDFPYLFGNRLSLLSLEDGKEYWIMDYQHIMKGFYPFYYEGDKIYGQFIDGLGAYHEIYEVDIITGKRRGIIDKWDMGEYIVLDGKMIYNRGVDANILEAYDIKKKNTEVIATTEEDYIHLLSPYGNYAFAYVREETEEYIIRYNTESRQTEKFPLIQDLYEDDSRYEEGFKYSFTPFSEKDMLIAFEEGGIAEYDIETQKYYEVVSPEEASNLLDGDPFNAGIGMRKGRLYYCVDGKGIFKKNKDKKAELMIPWEEMADKSENDLEISVVFAKDYAVVVTEDSSGIRKYKSFYLKE